MRILIIGSVFPRHPSDDQVPWLRETCRLLVEAGHTVEALIPAHRGLASHTLEGIRVHRFRYGPASLEILTGEEGAPSKMRRNPFMKLMAVSYLWCGFWSLVGLLLTRRYDVVEVHWPWPHAALALPATLFGVPVIYHYHSAELKLLAQSRPSTAFFKLLMPLAKAHVANSGYTASLIKALKPSLPVEVIAYGSPLKLTAAAPAFPEPTELFRLLFVGRHIERKGIETLIAAMALLPARFQLTIVGEGDRTPALKALAAHDPRITFTGRLSSEALAAAYTTHHAFVLPAIIDSKGDTEGLGVVLIEAIAARLPLVASNVGGIPDVVLDNQTGLLVPQKDPAALAAALSRLAADAALATRLTTAATAHAEVLFSWPNVLERTQALFARIARPSSK